MMMRRTATLAIFMLGLGLPGRAAAQTETRAAVAESLYRQARDLMAEGKYDEACLKLAESQRLDPATGTLLNLAACHEHQGKLATAWLEYSDAQVAARRDGRQDRVEYAHARTQELEPKLSHLTLSLAAAADDPTLEIELDGASVGRAVLGASTPVDPGAHTVRVTANGKKPWTAKVEIAGVAQQQTLVIPPLEAAPPAPVPARPSPMASSPRQPAAPRDELGRPIPSSVYVAGSITLALTAGATVSGIVYLNKRSDYQDNKYASDAGAMRDTAQRYGAMNIGLWAGTLVGAGVTTYLYVTRPSRPAARAELRPRVAPWAAPRSAGLCAWGDF